MKYFSLFTGIGGFELGINEKGECVGYSEIDKYALQIFRKHYPKLKNYGDATKIDTKKLPNFDLLVGGFPCQAFSIAGKRGGFDDTRGTLFFEIARITRDKRPRHLLLENVKGLLCHKKGKTFHTILRILTDLGYRVEWQVLNSKHFGVPQNRERVFIIGHLRGECGRRVFPIGGTTKATLKYITGGGIDMWTNDGKNLSRNHSQGQRVYDSDGISSTLSSQGGGWGAKTGLYAIPVLTPDRINKRQHGRRFKTDGEPSFTLTGQDKHGVYKDSRIRRLTPTECERLQGFPDGWTEKGIDKEGNEVEISDTQRYKTLGNAVTVNVIKAISKKLYFKCLMQPGKR